VPTRDRLRASRALKTLRTGQRFLEGFECLRALRGGHIRLEVPGAGVLRLGQPAGSGANRGQRRACAGHAPEQKASARRG